MNCTSGPIRLARVLAPSTIVLLALLALLACGDSTGEPVPSPTPRSVLFATPPSAASTGDDDESGSDITVELNQTATPYPTSTPYPTATPYPTPTPYPVAVGSGEQTSGPGPSVPEVTTVAPQAGPTIRIAIPKKSEVKHPKADSAINSLVERVESGEITEEEAASEAPLHRGDSVGVIILLSGNVGGVAAFLEANGATNINAGEDYIEAFVPVLHLGQTSEQPGVLRVDQIQPPGETQGTPQVTGQGPGVHGSEAWNDAGFSGQGIKVGVIDRGFSGFSDIKGTEVPATVEARCYTWLGQHSRNLSDCSDGGTHGTVVSESVLDIAPEVTLYISDPQSLSELRDAVDWMISEGVSVINHSRLWAFDGPGDGTSPLSISPLNSIDRAVTAGIVWVNAAGNQATGTWFKRGPFDYTTETIDGEEVRFLRFSGSEIRNTNSYIGGRLELRWEDEWGGAETDLDLFALASGTDEIVLQSIDLQSGGAGHNPYESVGSIATFDVMVAHRGGPDPDWIQLVGWGPTRLTLNSSGAGSIINPAESANRGMLAVGAAPWSNTNVISSFSSRGPTPDERIKPDVVAANCGETATRSAPFCGTSQASPHVAGLAALVRQRFPNYTPAQVVSYIKNNAEQRISSLDPNNTWGHGFFVLPTVTQATQPPVTVPGAPSVTSVTQGTGSLTVAWRAPLQTGGAAITAYDLRHIRSDAPSRTDGNWTVVRRVWSGAGALSYTLTGLTGGTRYDVQVRAVNPAGEGPWSPTRTGTTTQATPCATGGAVANAASNAGLVSDCDTLLELRNTLAGTGTLNWAAGTPITNWDGITVGGTPQRIIMLYLPHQGLTGILPQELGDLNGLTQLTLLDNKLTGPIPSELANLSQLTHIFLGDNQLSAPIPSELGRMTKLQGLELYGNRLTGTIPTELAGLTNLQALHIDTNQLTGVIPRELGRLTNLKWLTLHDNQLTGEIPAELGRLTHLEQLWLAGNQFAGCVPADLRNVFSTDRTHRLKDIGIPYCDVLLSGLGITSSTLSPQFDAYVTDYRAAARASRITVSPSSRHNATFEYLDGDDNVLADSDGAQAGYQVDAPATMATTIKIKVTSSDDKANHTYTIQLTGPGALGAPEVHQVTAGTNSLTVSWTAPSSDGGSSITAYDLRHIRSDATNKGDTNWTVVQDVWTGSGALSYEMTGLDGGVSYDVQVRAVNNAGDGAWSTTATGTPEATTPVPASPADTQFHRDGATTVVTWGPSTGATHYKVYHSDSRFARCTLLLSGTLSGCGELSGSVSGTTYTHTDPDADTNHYWVTACNSAGCSEIDSSNPARFMDNRPPAPANSQFRRDGSTTLISWDPSTGATHYKVYYDDFFDSSCRLSRGSPSFCDELAGNVSGTSYTHTDPDENENYYWVTACNNAGCLDIDSANPAAFVETTPVVTAPGAPTRLTATADGQTEIDLSWTGPSDDGGVDITGYRIEVSNNGSSWSNLEANTNSASTTYTHTGLMAGDTRHYRVSAINSEGTGPVSDTDDATTNSPAVATPGAPTSLTATADGETEIDLSWTAPSDNGGADITGYKIEVSTNGSTWSDLEANTGNAATTYSHTGLTAGSTRHFRVSAINSAVTGPASITDSATTNAATPSDTRACATDGAVASPDNNEDLVSECEVLLGLKNRLVGTGSLNWSPSTLISSWDGITVGGSPARVTRLELRVGGSKRVTGQLPAALGELAKLEVLAIYGASTGDGEPISLTGSIPAELGNLTELSELTLHQHEISGTIPAALGNLSKLEKLQLNFTQIGGSIPASLGNLSKLKTLSLYDNDLSGTLPAELGRLGNLQTLNLNLNRVTGSIPAQFGNLSSLLTLALSFNQLSGSIPTELAGLSSLQEIYVSQNNFTGCIPSALQEVAKNDLARVGLPDCDGSTEPGKPTGLAAAADGQSEIDLSWTAPSDDGGADITGYRIEVSNNGSNWTDLVADTNSTRTSYSHTGLAAGSTRHYRVSAINSAGTGPVSNTDSATTDAATAPDLVLDAPTVSNSNPVVGTLFGFSITVRNQGNGAAKGGLVGYLISIDPTVTLSDRLLERDHSFGRLAPGETRSLTTPLTAPSTPGTYYYAACVRLDGTGEIDTTNNCSTSVKVTVSSPPAPDLSVDMPTVDDSTLETGDSFTLSATVRNGGDASSASTTLRYYRSTDSTITSSDTSAGTDSVSGLNAGGSGNESIDLTAPSTAGTYYYGACVDSVSGESDTTNNCSSGVAVTVSTTTAPVQATTCSVDLVVSPGESCVYPGQSDEFSVDSSGRGSFLFTTSGERIEIRNSNINGVTYTLVAGKQSDGTWKIEEVG